MTSLNQKKKAKRMAIIGVLCVLLVVALCFVFGFAIAEGWGAVLAWFTSKWATLVIIFAVVVIGILVYAFFAVKDKEDFK